MDNRVRATSDRTQEPGNLLDLMQSRFSTLNEDVQSGFNAAAHALQYETPTFIAGIQTTSS